MKPRQPVSRLFLCWVAVLSCGLPSMAALKAGSLAQIVGLASKPAPVFNDCSSNQVASLEQALRDAESLARNSFLVLKGTPEGQRVNSTRYREWFGSYDRANYAAVMDHFQQIYDALVTQEFTFNCGCTDLLYAVVSPDHPYVISLCASFWPAPSTGTNSRAGTLVHEISHFTIVAGATDHVYGQTFSRLAAQHIPAKAIENADSYRYFAENEPQLEPRYEP